MESCQWVKHTTSPVSIYWKSTTSIEVEKYNGNGTGEEFVREFPLAFSAWLDKYDTKEHSQYHYWIMENDLMPKLLEQFPLHTMKAIA